RVRLDSVYMATRTVRGTCGIGGTLEKLVGCEADVVSTACASDERSGTTGTMNSGANRDTSSTTEISLEFLITEFSQKGVNIK
ncbi:MAG: hypothetical protein ACFFCH_11195, partial [Promethearchaeota archaeon]